MICGQEDKQGEDTK